MAIDVAACPTVPDALTDLHASVLYGCVLLAAVVELALPWREARAGLGTRWLTNFALAGGNLLLIRLVVPVSAIAVAQLAQAGWGGLLAPMNADPAWALGIGILVLDFWKYVEHWLAHRVHPLWRLHLVHHADPEVDFTTGERHHPLEALVFGFAFLAVVWLLGVPPAAVAVYTLLGTAFAFWTHANLRVPPKLDRVLRVLLVTPRMHLVHHSAHQKETDSNYGQVFSIWDRLFGTYTVPTASRGPARLGLDEVPGLFHARLDRVLLLPLRWRRRPSEIEPS